MIFKKNISNSNVFVFNFLSLTNFNFAVRGYLDYLKVSITHKQKSSLQIDSSFVINSCSMFKSRNLKRDTF